MNVVLVIIDSLRRDHVGAYGNGWIKTPNLDALAEESLRDERQDVLDEMWNDYVLADAGGPLPRY